LKTKKQDIKYFRISMISSNHPSITQPIAMQGNRQFQIKLEEHPTSNPPTFKRKFPSILPPITSDYMVETHYQASSFQNNFELLKKVIIDLAGDKEDNCEYDIIVKKRKVLRVERHQTIQQPQQMDRFPMEEKEKGPLQNLPQVLTQETSPNEEKHETGSTLLEKSDVSDEDKSSQDSKGLKEKDDILPVSAKHRHKNCPKLFGRAFFNLVLNNKEFKTKYLQKTDFSKKIEEISYPKNVEINLNDFYNWIKKEKFNEKYTNLKVFRDIWSWRSDSNENWLEKHYKYYLSKLMKIFFENYAYTYIITSNIQHENGNDYINFIPKFLNGIENPQNFCSLKD